MTGYSPETLKRAKSLRRTMTEAEKKLWIGVRGRQIAGAKFRKQQPIGPFIADFVCQEAKLIVEADGSQHDHSERDEMRTAWLERAGYRVIRFWNSDILTNPASVFEAVRAALSSPHPPTASLRAPPSPSRGEGFSDGASLA